VERNAVSTLNTSGQQIDRYVIGDTVELGIGPGFLAARDGNLARSPNS
jgi:hypothetical protein